eukprot:scaffold1206_cov388-Prasinococcus_capsulatus_cf.AAC.4
MRPPAPVATQGRRTPAEWQGGLAEFSTQGPGQRAGGQSPTPRAGRGGLDPDVASAALHGRLHLSRVCRLVWSRAPPPEGAPPAGETKLHTNRAASSRMGRAAARFGPLAPLTPPSAAAFSRPNLAPASDR